MSATLVTELHQSPENSRHSSRGMRKAAKEHLMGELIEALEDVDGTSEEFIDDEEFCPGATKISKKPKLQAKKRKLSKSEEDSEETGQPPKKKPKITGNTSISTYPSSASSAHLASHGRSWTEEEKQQFINGVKLYGRGKWVQIAEYIETRNALQVKNHARNYYRRLEAENSEVKNNSSEDDLDYIPQHQQQINEKTSPSPIETLVIPKEEDNLVISESVNEQQNDPTENHSEMKDSSKFYFSFFSCIYSNFYIFF